MIINLQLTRKRKPNTQSSELYLEVFSIAYEKLLYRTGVHDLDVKERVIYDAISKTCWKDSTQQKIFFCPKSLQDYPSFWFDPFLEKLF